jgi:hypothetical protein
MENAVRIDGSSGLCTPIAIRRTTRGVWWFGKTRLHVHHQTQGVTLLSSASLSELKSEAVGVFDWVLPPPLDAYVYPAMLIAALYDQKTNSLGTLAPAGFVNLCSEFASCAERAEEIQAVYDVPAVPINYNQEDDADFLSEEEDLVSSDEEEGNISADDVDWEDDDDDIQSVA